MIKLDLFQLILKSQRETKKSTKNLTCHWRCLPRFELSGRDVHLPANRFPTAISTAFSLVTVLGEYLFTGLENVFQCASIVGRTSIPEQLNRDRRNRQQESDQDSSEVTHEGFQPRRFFLADEDARFSIAAIITV